MVLDYDKAIVASKWRMWFDGAARGAGVIIKTPNSHKYWYAFKLTFVCSTNQAEYEDLIISLEILVELKVGAVEMYEDSMLVINQIQVTISIGTRHWRFIW